MSRTDASVKVAAHYRLQTSPAARFLRPFRRFIQNEVSGGIILLVATLIALIWANSPWGESYTEVWETHLALTLGETSVSLTLVELINEALMALFFLLVGLEIKREVLFGELSSLRQALLPALAAVGGMIVPAALYLAVTVGREGSNGWGVPMATDIAFAVGVLALVGRRAPGALSVFLTALAIVDDIGAILVIAVFYSDGVVLWPMAAALGVVLLLLLANRLRVWRLTVYVVLGGLLWAAFLASGIHATLAGVVLALTLPAVSYLSIPTFVGQSRRMLTDFEEAADIEESVLCSQDRQVLAEALEEAARGMRSPLARLEDALRPWVIFGIVPLFALANAGVHLQRTPLALLREPVGLGIILGLVVGKQVGIFATAWAATRSGLGAVGEGVRSSHLYGAAWLGGIGFTVSLFIATLAFRDTPLLSLAKEAILTASVVSALGGWVLLRVLGRGDRAARR